MSFCFILTCHLPSVWLKDENSDAFLEDTTGRHHTKAQGLETQAGYSLRGQNGEAEHSNFRSHRQRWH